MSHATCRLPTILISKMYQLLISKMCQRVQLYHVIPLPPSLNPTDARKSTTCVLTSLKLVRHEQTTSHFATCNELCCTFTAEGGFHWQFISRPLDDNTTEPNDAVPQDSHARSPRHARSPACPVVWRFPLNFAVVAGIQFLKFSFLILS